MEKKSKEEKINYTYYQFGKDVGYPVYVRFDPNFFSPNLKKFFVDERFSEVPEKDVPELEKKILSNQQAKLLTLELATPYVSSQIDRHSETDQFGLEGITPKDGHKIYRFKGMAIIVYSSTSKFWRMGCYDDFGTEKNLFAYRSIIHRFLSWALAPLGVVGFWGVPVDEGMVVLRQLESKGECVFVDLLKQKLLTVDGIKKMPGRFQLLRLDQTLKGRNILMRREELISFLSQYCVYFDYEGLSIPVRQMIQSISKVALGLLHPKESFKPRTDLSLS